MNERFEQAVLVLGETNGDGMPGHVYFVQGESGGPIKIGYTAVRSRVEPASYRLRQLQKASPIRLAVLGVWQANRAQEAGLHRVFAADRLHGEWFTPSVELLHLIEWLDDPDELRALHSDLFLSDRAVMSR